MPHEFVSERVEEFFNHFHSPKDGKFAVGGAPGRYRSGAGKGLFSIAKTSKSKGKLFTIRRKPPTSAWNHHRTMWSSAAPQEMSANVQEFYNHVHGKGGKFASGHAASGRAGFREGSPGAGKISTTGVSKAGGLPQVATLHKSGTVSYRESAPGLSSYRGMGQRWTAAKHKKTEVSPGEVYTSLKGSHTIRKTKAGKFVLHTKNSAPQVVSKAGAEHVKMLDSHKTTAAESVRGKMARWHAKG